MARTTHVKSARKRKEGKAPYRCYDCGQPIEEGQSYYWNQPSRFSSRYNWHATCKRPPASMLESNDKRATAMGHFEAAYDAINGLRDAKYVEHPENEDESGPETLIEDIKTIIGELAGGMEEVAEMYRESQNNIEEGFGHETESSAQQGEWADEYDSMQSEADSVADNLEDWNEDADESFDDWMESAIEAAESGIGDVEGMMP